MTSCPCCSSKDYADCCGPFISGKAFPSSPETLMRSRYTAYSSANIDYIQQTMKGPAAKGFNKSEARDWAKHVTWLGLEVLNSKQDKDRGWVEFIARFSDQGVDQKIHELSEFKLEEGKWYYVDGKMFS